MIKKILATILLSAAAFLGMASNVLAAPDYQFNFTLLPVTNNGNDLGTTTSVLGSARSWRNIFYLGNLVNANISDGCARWNTGVLESTGVACGTGSGGGGSAGGTMSTSTAWGSIYYNYPNNQTDILLVGYDGTGVATSTNEAEFYLDPVAKLSAFLNGTKVGIGTTTPYAPLSVVGQAVAAYFTATTSTASTFPYASSTAITTSEAYISSLTTARVPYTSTGGRIVTSSGLQFNDTANRLTATYASTTGASAPTLFTSSIKDTSNILLFDVANRDIMDSTGEGVLINLTDDYTGFFNGLADGCLQISANKVTNSGGRSCEDIESMSGVLPVANGGTGQFTWGQGWIHSSGGQATLTSSTSPTVNYIVATSTTKASIFPYASTTAMSATTICLTGDTCRTTWPSSSAVGGSDTQVQFNDGGSALGGDSGFTYNKTADRATFTYATTTAISIANSASTTEMVISNSPSALLKTSSAGVVSVYTGTSCTNQFVRSLSALGVATCATVGTSDISLASHTNGATLLGSAYNGSSAISDWDIDLSNPNTWTGLQQFSNSTSTLFSATYASTTELRQAGKKVLSSFDKSLVIASTTPDSAYKTFNSATTTFMVWNPSVATGASSLFCKTTKGTVTVELGTGSASTTVIATTAGVSSASTLTWAAQANVYFAYKDTSASAADSVTCTATYYNN